MVLVGKEEEITIETKEETNASGRYESLDAKNEQAREKRTPSTHTAHTRQAHSVALRTTHHIRCPEVPSNNTPILVQSLTELGFLVIIILEVGCNDGLPKVFKGLLVGHGDGKLLAGDQLSVGVERIN